MRTQNLKPETRNLTINPQPSTLNLFRFVFCFLVILLNAAIPAMAWEKIYTFDKDLEGIPPDGFVIETAPNGKALINVLPDPEALSKPNVLALRGSSFPGSNTLMCLAWFTQVENGDLSVGLKHGGEPEAARTAGLLWRYQSSTETYSLELDTRESLLSLILISNGKRKILKKEEVNLPKTEWATLRVKFQGQEIRCEMNDKLIFTAKDSQLTTAGRVGIFLKSDKAIFFDNFHIQAKE